ncbi:GlxA family transcriptional regulator [Pseudonocardia humida]|uniref:Helix-turn-helix domain-containing protein n=1 Tax=Pseudonocardia humida TaxID=2800819 RepID=A0ABT1AA03_9PSEU|nr:helix-turn-helix domain-containing protein [Pseudonocardia humida]MCO1659867.1 helix-turn-helix domain-containing protein [Pseudonocardia humida]
MRKESDVRRRHRVVLVASPGVPLFELAIAAQVFGTDRSDITPDWYEFAIVGVDGADTRIEHGISVPGGAGLPALRGADTVIVPACAQIHGRAPEALLGALRAAHQRGARIAAICSGSFVLAEAGLLDGRRATTHWMHADELARRHPAVTVDPAVLYVCDDVWTSAGSAAGLDMCLELVRRDLGAAVANEVARRTVTPPHRDGGQAQYSRPAAGPAAQPRRDVLDWARRNIADATVTGMADHAGISARTLNRQFHDLTGRSPQAWLQRLRLDTAAELLESTDLTVHAIARRVGLGTATNLRMRFTGTYGVPPTRYRQTFGPRAVPAAAD